MRKFIVLHNEDNETLVIFTETILGVQKERYSFNGEEAVDCAGIMIPTWGMVTVRETIGEVMRKIKMADAKKEKQEGENEWEGEDGSRPEGAT